MISKPLHTTDSKSAFVTSRRDEMFWLAEKADLPSAVLGTPPALHCSLLLRFQQELFRRSRALITAGISFKRLDRLEDAIKGLDVQSSLIRTIWAEEREVSACN